MNAMFTRWLIVAATALVLGVVNASIAGKERIKARGDVVYLELAPVDPRSLLQGDYMALQFHLARAIEREELGTGNARGSAWRKEGAVGFVGVELDARRVATLAPQGAATAMHLRYRVRNGQVWLGTNAFFFAEGAAAHYSGARYGEFRIDAQSGEAVLVGLRDVNLQVL